MIRKIVDNILPYIIGLNFIEITSGCVTTISKTVIGDGNKKVIKRFPAYYNDDKTPCNNYESYKDLIPDSKKKSILYFEENGIQQTGGDAYYNYMRGNFKLIFWCNIKNINSTLNDSYMLKQLIIKNIPDFLQNIAGEFSFIRLTFKGEDKKDVSIFSKYSYNEEEKQYLIYPFDYFALNYQVDFYANKYCTQEINLNPAICQ